MVQHICSYLILPRPKFPWGNIYQLKIVSVPQENKDHLEEMRHVHKAINYTDNAEVLRLFGYWFYAHTHIKTEIMSVYVHLYNRVEIISPPFLKIHVCGSVD